MKITHLCIHCATPIPSSIEDEKFCCRGCEFVYELIHDEGMERFYELRSDTSIKPVRSVPFEARDFAWLQEQMDLAEAKVEKGDEVEAEFSLEGLSCVGCVWLVESVFQRQKGGLEAAAHPTTGLLFLRWISGETDLPAFADELASFGYRLISRKAGQHFSEARALVAKLGLCGAFMLNAMVFTIPNYFGMPEDFAFAGIFRLVSFLSATLAMMVGGSYFIKRAWQAALARTPHIDLPIALGILCAFLGSIIGWIFKIEGLMYFDFVATFIFLMLAGRYLQLAAVEKNRARLHRARPLPETVSIADGEAALPLSEIAVDMRVCLLPGQSVPVAGILETEVAEFSLEWINGEAEPQTFSAGRAVPAGAIYLGSQPIVFAAAETWEESLLAQLTSSERRPSRVPKLERLLRFYLFAVVVVGLLGFAFWYVNAGFAPALQVMISVFVVSCPCALGIALPLADELANSQMERRGVFIREPLIWSRLRSIKKIIFDKTGTLTLERPRLMNPEEILQLSEEARKALALLTSGSLHPVSRTLLEALGTRGQQSLRSEEKVEIEDVPGMGRRAGSWTLGRPGWAGGNTESTFSHDNELCFESEIVSRFRFSESLRPDAISALESLRNQKFRLIILSGDRKEKVIEAADLLKIAQEDAHGSLQPEEKEKRVCELDDRDTLYLGDGANDSLAFNAAWVTGTPVVDRSFLEGKADFYFLGQGLRFLPELLHLARRRIHAVRFAFSFALIYNIVAVTACLFGLMNPLIAAIIMPLSSAISLAIIGVSLRK